MTTTPSVTTTDVLAGIDLSGTSVLVTGGTTGLGKETARALAAAGATVVITARSADKGVTAVTELRAATPGCDVDFAVLELASLRSVRDFCSRFRESRDHVDVVIANAGIMAVPFGHTDDGFELHFGTNHLGHFVLIGRLLPMLLTGAPARVVILSSGGHAASDIRWDDPNFEQGRYTKMEAYGQSKTANILHAVELQRRYGAHGLRAYSVHPGMVTTDLGRHFTREDYKDLVARAQASATGGLPPRVGVDVGAATSVWAAVADSLEAHGGAYLADCAIAEAQPYATDPDAARRLWALSEKLTSEHFPEV